LFVDGSFRSFSLSLVGILELLADLLLDVFLDLGLLGGFG
jgi:hypothetical protein